MDLIIRRSERFKKNYCFAEGRDSKISETNKVRTDFTANLADYEFGPVIGKSSFVSTKVFAGKYSKTNDFVAVKRYDIDAMSVDEIALLQREIDFLNKLKHENIVALLTLFDDGVDICVCFPLVEYRSCADIIMKHFHTGLPEVIIQIVLKDVLLGLRFIHGKGVIHRAIKASHMLISSVGCVKLCGFRYAYQMEADRHGKWRKVFEFPPHSESNLKWMSPDILQQNCNGYDEKSDIYSLGVTICELANGFVPYFDMKLSSMLLQKIDGGKPLIYDVSTLEKLKNTPDREVVNVFSNYFSNRCISKRLHAFKDLCCTQNPDCRPNCTKLLSNNLLAKVERNRKSFELFIKPAVPITEKYFSSSVEVQNSKSSCLQTSESFEWDF